MKDWWKIIKINLKHHFVRDVFILQIGNGVGTLLSFAAALVMARVFKPDLYGQYVLIFSLVGLFGLLMNWGEETTATTLLAEAYNRKDRPQILEIIAYYFKVTIIVIFTVGLLSFALAPILANLLYHQAIIGSWARIIILTNICLVGYSFLLAIFTVIRKIAKFTILDNFNKLAINSGIIVAVFLGLGVWGAIYVQLLVAVPFFIVAYFWYKKIQQRDDLLPTWREIGGEIFQVKIRKYFKLGIQVAFDKNIINFRSLIPTLLMGYLLISANVAYYRVAFSYISLTLLLLSPISSLLMVQLPKTKVYGSEPLKARFKQTAIVGGVISVFLTLGLVILAPFLVKLFYGSEYLAAIPLIYVLAIYFSIAGFGLGLGTIFITLKKVKYSIISNVIILVLSLYPAWWLIGRYGSLGAAWWVAFVYSLNILVNLLMANYFLKHYPNTSS